MENKKSGFPGIPKDAFVRVKGQNDAASFTKPGLGLIS